MSERKPIGKAGLYFELTPKGKAVYDILKRAVEELEELENLSSNQTIIDEEDE